MPNKKYKTYDYPATKKPYLGTLIVTQKKFSPKVKVPTYKSISVPFSSLARGIKNNKIA